MKINRHTQGRIRRFRAPVGGDRNFLSFIFRDSFSGTDSPVKSGGYPHGRERQAGDQEHAFEFLNRHDIVSQSLNNLIATSFGSALKLAPGTHEWQP